MEIDDKLKNRLAGAAVVTVLAVIFLPMLFDDPVEKKGQVVSELDIPRKPEVSPLLTTAIVPEKTAEIAAKPTDSADDLADDSEKVDAAVNSEELPLTPKETEKEESSLASKNADENVTADSLSADEPVEKSKPKESHHLSSAMEEESPPVKKKEHKKAPPKSENHDKPVTKAKAVRSKEPKNEHSSEDEKSPKPKEVKKSHPEAEPKVAEKKVEKVTAEQTHSKSQLPTLDINALDKTPHTEAAVDKHRWVVQVVSLSDKAKAEAFRDKLRTQGFPATVDSVWLNGKGRVYRLKVGPELDAERAQSMKTKINQLNGVHSIAISE